jgi:MerR family mercuric resistance operon transcriptional regulator
MDHRYTIGQLASAAGIPTSTVRYYERVGLVKPLSRSGANYRLYAEEALERLRFIRAAQATGFTLDDVTQMVGHRQTSTASCREVQRLIESRLLEVKQRMEALRRVERVLESALDACRKTEQPGYCELIDRLSHTSCPCPERSRRNSHKKRP